MPQIKDVTSTLGIGEDLQTMLLFNHDLGRIIYFGNLCKDKSYLKDIVILDPKWIIDVFKEVITLNTPRDMVLISHTFCTSSRILSSLTGSVLNSMKKNANYVTPCN